MRNGYYSLFEKWPKLGKVRQRYETRLPHTQMEVVHKEVSDLVMKGAVRKPVLAKDETGTDRIETRSHDFCHFGHIYTF